MESDQISKTKGIVTFYIFGILFLVFLFTAPFWALKGEYGMLFLLHFRFR
ncbi:hypothetical protein LEP1GSC024_4312 [Leptospira noguchii str. 2001034031]|uniref:Uncharacterized protein n=1 Tax=Leptospira noguchii str. 2001034031 TaxID=1193053 RepID=M6YGX7_9LEPT|nr:hypothetical protein LEP1GSC024_4312 [Leptospira noguchii str. 2001034031]